jgi:putative transcriptional regulator
MGRNSIDNNIRKLRFLNGEMTQQELANKTGVTRQTIVAIENGKYFPTLELAFRISHVFAISLGEVFMFNPQNDPVLKKQNKADSPSGST